MIIPENWECIIEDGIATFREKKQGLPRSWEEFCKKYPVKRGESYILSSTDSIFTTPEDFNVRTGKCWCTSKEEAEAFGALMQLRQLRKAWVGDWEPTSETKLFAWIETSHIHHKTYINYGTQACGRVLSFPTFKMAEDFLNCFRDLCETAKILL